MRRLTLVGFTDDGSEILFTAEPAKTGPESRDGTYVLALDEHLQAALRKDRSRLGQLQLADSTTLRPKDIQDRVRSGQSPEQVAADSGVPVARVMAFALPVLAEREHLAEVAQGCVLRHRSGPDLTLLAAVEAAVERSGGSAADLAWDAFKREDGTWIVTVSGAARREAEFAFVPAARSVVAENTVARELLADPEPPASAAASAIPVTYDPSFRAGRPVRGAGAAPAPEPARAEPDAGETDEEAEHTARLDPVESAASARHDLERRTDRERGHGRTRRTLRYLAFRDETGSETGAEHEPAAAGRVSGVPAPHPDPAQTTLGAVFEYGRPRPAIVEADAAEAAAAPVEEPAPDATADSDPDVGESGSRGQRSLRRPAVPSWDEIMFGRRGDKP